MSKMTAKVATAILKGELDRMRATASINKLTEQRLARAEGGSVSEVGTVHDKALNRVEEAYEYALNALAVAKQRNKNAPKEAKSLGVFVGVALTGQTAAQEPVSAPSAPAPSPFASGSTIHDPPVYEPDEDEDEEYNEP